MKVHDHEVVPGRLPGTEKCTKCSWRFPCRDHDCGHLDCIEFRRELPLCHYCRRRVEGSPCGVSSVTSSFEPLQHQDDAGTWTIWSIRGITRATHYSCRSENASPLERVRWGEEMNP